MEIYFVLSSLGDRDSRLMYQQGVRHFLISAINVGCGYGLAMNQRKMPASEIARIYDAKYYDEQKIPRLSYRVKRAIEYYKSRGVKFFLDSSAFQVKEHVGYMSLDQYIDFLRCYGKRFDVVAALDVIGNTEKSLENYKYMLRNGVDHDSLVLAWHVGQPFELIDKVLALTDYIGIGGMASSNDAVLATRLLNKAIRRINERYPKARIHLFGTAMPMTIRSLYDRVTSTDSSAWCIGYKYARVLSLSGQKNIHYGGRINHSTSAKKAVDAYNIFKIVQYSHT